VLDLQRVRELAGRYGSPAVTSLYLDVDGRRYPRRTDYEPRFTALCHEAKHQAASVGPAVLASVEADLARMRGWLESRSPREGARGIAMFSCSAEQWFEAQALPVPVRDAVRVGTRPDVAQLIDVLNERKRVLVVLADRRVGRLVHVEPGAVDELEPVLDAPERQVDNDVELGGWDHRREEAARRHFRRVAAAVRDEAQRGGADFVILCGSGDDLATLRCYLDDTVATRVAETLALPVSASADEIDAAVEAVMRETTQHREEELATRLEEGDLQGKAVLGVKRVLAALAEHRVADLLVGRGFTTTGTRCAVCGHVGVAACNCPSCGAPASAADDIVDVAIDRAMAQGATVTFCGAHRAESFGGIGATVRY